MPNAGELSISWQCFGSNGQEKADYSRGVLERFTMRESKDKSPTKGCKCIADPRKIHHIESPHWVALFEGFVPVTEDGKVKTCNRWILEPQFTDKIVVNHYRCMSWEEYAKRAPRGDASAHTGSKYSREFFKKVDLNDEFDDGILKYRDARAENFSLESNEQKLNRVTDSLIETLSSYAGGKIFDLETTLTCLALSRYMREKFPNDSNIWETCEKTSLEAVLKSIGDLSIAEAQLLIHELPNLLTLPYPVVNELREVCLHIISQMMDIMRLNNRWKDYVELDYIQRLLKIQK